MTATQAFGERRGRRRGELTVADVARLAGVSAPTVSKVLNGRPGVAEDTRRRVEAVLREHGYQRPEAVPSAALLEVAFHALEGHLAVEIMRGVEQVARDYELAVGFTELSGRQDGRRSWTDEVLARRPVGVIVVYSHHTAEEQARLAASGIPLVALDPTGKPLHSTPSVGATNWSGGLAATQHLLGLGHRRIATITGPAQYLCSRARLDGFRAAMDAAGVPVDESLVRSGRFTVEDGLALGADLLRAQRPPTAVVAGNDLQAIGVYEAARRGGLDIPGQLSVVGFDDVEYARWCGPPLTTVRQPLVEMGATAARLVLALAAGEQPDQTRIELATTLVIRESTAAPRA
jgi:LacI family transcriptional regulator, xylobiose transport system transcriptional regulator